MNAPIEIAEFVRGYRAFERRERRDAMYKVASSVIQNSWGNPAEMANGLGVLLMTWNQAFYRYGPFNYDALERCIRKNLRLLKAYRRRDMLSLSKKDEAKMKRLFRDFLRALKICEGKMRGRKSPVAVAKALHLLAPKFFALWDDKIARAYNCFLQQRCCTELRELLLGDESDCSGRVQAGEAAGQDIGQAS
jgi:hypothetical protein